MALEIEASDRINFAMQQNGVPLVRRIRLINRGSREIRDVNVQLRSEPEFFPTWSRRIDLIGPGREVGLDSIDLRLSPEYLVNLSEAIRGRIWVEIDSGTTRLTSEQFDVELLAYDEWPGISQIPEIIAAFALPNHPAVAQVLSVAADLLEKATNDSALNGYQSEDPRRVWAMAGAIYRAVQVLDVEYVNPPASFEEEGQKIRTPDRVLGEQRGTCLDLTLLLAACLEQAGLHPWIVLVRGHAFPGLWLSEQRWPTPLVDDASSLRKRRDLGEIQFLDSSSVAQRPFVDFDSAVRLSTPYLDNEADFLFAVDLAQARRSGRIRPIAGRIADGGFKPLIEPDRPDEGSHASWSPSALPASVSQATTPAPATERRLLEGPAARIDRWKRKLLDLSLRNRLLNFRETKKTIPLLIPDLATFEDTLAAGKAFEVTPVALPDDTSASSLADALRNHDPALKTLLDEQLGSGRLVSGLSERELDRRLTETYREARSRIEETGANTLYLALGMLRWFPNESTSEPRQAPILLVPLEIKRRSARDRFRISIGADEPRVNHTLLEMLRQDFGVELAAIEELPSDESGIDVPLVLRTVRHAIRDVARWDVIEEAWIGIFSFSKFLMWRDLAERTEALLENPVIAHIVNADGGTFDADGDFVARDDVETISPDTILCPLDADASQLAAVLSADAGRSFALWGPPGTGKSQTITNLIAHCLANGKTVLFVAEKMAALNVVHSRLDKVGLGRFCLELHSNKASKADVLAQLGEALQTQRTSEPQEWTSEAARLSALRTALNQYATALGQPRPPGWTVFQVTSDLTAMRETESIVLSWPGSEVIDHDRLEDLRASVRRLATVGDAISGPAEHPWRGVRRREWSSAWQGAVDSALQRIEEAALRVSDALPAAAGRLAVSGEWTLPRLMTLAEACRRLLDDPRPSRALLEESQWRDAEADLRSTIDKGRSRDSLRSQLAERFTDEIFALDLSELRSRLQRALQSNALLRWFRKRPVLRALRGVTREGDRVDAEQALEAIDNALAIDELHAALEASGDEAKRLLGREWKDGIADWDRVESLVDWAGELRKLAARLASDEVGAVEGILQAWNDLACSQGDLLSAGATAARELESCASAIVELNDSWEAFCRAAEIEASEFLDEGENAPLSAIQARLARCRAGLPLVREWCQWRDARNQAIGLGIAPIVSAYESGQVTTADLAAVFEKSVRSWWLDQLSASEPVLAQFFSPDHERKITDFRALEEKLHSLASPLIAARLAASLPRGGSDPAAGSEMGILARELRKKARHMPVRRLIEKIPHLLPRLKPCFLMSPLSVAQYLDAGLASFDLVVFDEASQIPVWDSIGALARGKQSIVVGDPKQLPPTSFFSRSEDEDALEEVEVEDQESILDEFLATQMPQLQLDWHYRSRHESLIAFSNRHYYENRLLTFPSPLTGDVGVTHRPVPDGHYDKGNSRTNKKEAEALVDEVVRRLRDPEIARYSIGVVTFSQAQQSLVEDLIDDARRKNPEIEPYFGDAVDEPVFVKNLENVQGDERDVILFSIGYGPDSLGRVSMNFGPLNRLGGERRLNVAITRARTELIVFATLRSEQIDLTRTRAVGVEHLKFFLEFAERGPIALEASAALSSDADYDSPLERQIGQALQQRGHRVDLQVGCAGYRIDMAITDPDAPGRHLLGIECDGATYHRTRAARERDRLRDSVLCGLGWNLHRVWSTDWWQNPTREIEKIELALDRARATPPTRPRPSLAATPAPIGEEENKNTESNSDRSGSRPSASRDDDQGRLEQFARTTPANEPHFEVAPEANPYERSVLPNLQLDSDALYEAGAVPHIRELFERLIEEEAPVVLEFALRRVAEAWGLGRIGKRARKRLLDILDSLSFYRRVTAGVEVIWADQQQSEDWEGYRANIGTDERGAADIPPEEVLAAVIEALEANVSLSRDDLTRETARLLGFQRAGRVVQERVGLGIELATQRGVAVEEDGWIRHNPESKS